MYNHPNKLIDVFPPGGAMTFVLGRVPSTKAVLVAGRFSSTTAALVAGRFPPTFAVLGALSLVTVDFADGAFADGASSVGLQKTLDWFLLA